MNNPSVTENQSPPVTSVPASGYVPRYHSKGAYGNWWVTDADDNRIICMCNRQSDSEEIAKLLNGKGT